MNAEGCQKNVGQAQGSLFGDLEEPDDVFFESSACGIPPPTTERQHLS